jgi:hypothetical protein
LGSGGDCGQLIVRHDAHNKNSLARCDFVAGGEHSFLDSRAIQKGAVAAFLVDDAAAAGAAFHGEVHAGHAIVVGNCKLGAIGCATNQECLASWKRDLPPREWSRFHL